MAQVLNQFAQSPVLGMADLKLNTQTISCQIDSTEAGELVAGQMVKIVDSAGGVPKVVAADDDTDANFGFIAYDVKDKKFVANDKVEVFTGYGNVMYLLSTEAIARQDILTSAVATVGGVAVAAAGERIVGWALDKAAGSGELIRVMVNMPGFFKA